MNLAPSSQRAHFSGPVMNVDAHRNHLLARIHRSYQTITETLDIAGLTIDFTRIADPDRVLDQVAAEEDRLEKISGQRANEDQLHLPYWAELWDSARGVAQFLSNRKSKIENRKCLDL